MIQHDKVGNYSATSRTRVVLSQPCDGTFATHMVTASEDDGTTSFLFVLVEYFARHAAEVDGLEVSLLNVGL